MSPWIQAARPKTLLAGLSPLILSFAYLASQDIKIDLTIAALTILCTLLMQVGTNYVNDAIDAKTGVDNEQRLGPVRAVSAGLLSLKQMTWGYRFCFLTALIFGIPLMIEGGPVIVVMGLTSILMAYIYTAGPVPLSHYGLGEVLAFFFFGPWPVYGTLYLQTKQSYPESWMIGLSVGLASAALMAVNNLRDRENDILAHKTTMATMLGDKLAREFTLVLILLSSISTPAILCYLEGSFIPLIGLIPFFLFLREWRAVVGGKNARALNETLAKVGAFLFLSAALTSVGFLL